MTIKPKDIREAVAHLLDGKDEAEWPALVRDFGGEPGVTPFEAFRPSRLHAGPSRKAGPRSH